MVSRGMTSRSRTLVPAILALALFLSGIGAALAHDHPTGATCEVCKLTHNSPADLASRILAPEPIRAAERIDLLAASQPRPSDLAVPQGRAPPVRD